MVVDRIVLQPWGVGILIVSVSLRKWWVGGGAVCHDVAQKSTTLLRTKSEILRQLNHCRKEGNYSPRF